MSTFELPSGSAARHAGQPLLMLALLVLSLCTTPARGQYIVAGRITDGTVGVSNVTVQTVGQNTSQFASVTTDSNGDYSLSLGQDTYTVTPTKANSMFKPVSCLLQLDCPNNATVSVGFNLPSQTNVDFSVVYDIGGQVTDGTKGLSGVQVTVEGYPQSALTDASGNYTLSGFRSASYTLTPINANYTFDPASLVVNVASNVTAADFTAHVRFAVSGRITNGRSPVPNVNVALQNVRSLVTLTDVTDTTGAFAFTNLAFAEYTVSPSLLGYSFKPPSYSVSNQATVNFTVATQNLIGRITDGTSGLGLANVAVDAIAGTNVSSTFTDVDGNYSFKNLAGTYLIVASQAGQQFNPARRTLSVGSGPSSVDFQRAPTLFDVLVTSCDFPSLRLALSTGGTVGFDCGAAVGTIAVTETIIIATNAVLHAQGVNAALSGGNAVRIFTVNPSIHFTLNHLTLTAGKDAGASGTNGTPGVSGRGGAILNDAGMIVLSNCVLSANSAAGGNGGNGVVQLNRSGGGGGEGGDAFGGAIFNNAGSLSLTLCTVSGNTATAGAGGNGSDASSGSNGNNGGNGGRGGVGRGGAIYSTNGTVVVYDCTFASNTVSGATGGAGGAGTGLGANGTNGSPGDGLCGATCNDGGTLTVLFSTFNNNTATGANGGAGHAGTGEARGALGTAGSAAAGGALYNNAGSLAATNCTFDANTVTAGQGGNGGAGGTAGFGGNGGNGGNGGEGRGGGICNTANGSAVLVNCTIADNSAQGGAGGTGGAAGASVAKAGQDGQAGADFGAGIANSYGTVVLKNSLVGYSDSGGNGAGAITDGGSNLSDDASFALSAAGSLAGTNLDLKLGLLADNGGPTWTVPILSSDSPAVDAGNDADAPPVDQRHQARAGRTDIGAFEFNGASPVATLSILLQTDLVILSWTTALSGYSLQSNPDLSPTNWTGVTNAAAVVGNQILLTNSADALSRFYRLIK